MSRRGLTLFELLVALLVTALALTAASRAYTAGLEFERRYGKAIQERENRARLDDHLHRLLTGANLKGPFVSPISKQGASLVFTTWSAPAAYSFLMAESQDFEALNARFGPQGGPAEVAVSTEPVGDAGDRRGLFVRIQRPPDGDPTQGGEESLLDATIEDVRFEFFDGTNWVSSWDSRETQRDKLPSAVRISLFREGGSPQVLLVRLGGAV